MIIRIVKLTLQENKTQDFLLLFDKYKAAIKSSEGCINVEGSQNIVAPNIFFTYSYWKSEDDLNNYRNSPLFKEVWPQVKVWFAQKPETWSNKVI
jgi:quinol monooxygenase YgiN